MAYVKVNPYGDAADDTNAAALQAEAMTALISPPSELNYNTNLQPVPSESGPMAPSYSPWAALAGAVLGTAVSKVVAKPAALVGTKPGAKPAAGTASYLPIALIGIVALFLVPPLLKKRA
jgi:hypothetical protein